VSDLVTVRAVRGGATAGAADLRAVLVAEGALLAAVRGLGRTVTAAVVRRAKTLDFRGRVDETLVHHADRGILLLLGLGTADVGTWRRAGARLRRESERERARRVVVYVGRETPAPECLAALVEGFQLAGYRFDRHKAEPNGRRVDTLALVGETMPRPAELRPLLDGVAAVVTQVFHARDLVNEPPSIATPSFLAAHARRLAKEIPGLEVEVWNPARMAREGCHGVLAVARGAHEEPRFIRIRYAPRGAKRKIALVGKGITFDSGGLSLKPAKSMETMKYDMAGGAAVLSAVAAAAALGLPLDVTGYVPATENLPGHRAQKPGDLIRYQNGKTVEVLNTDAEGRLVLADALVLASRAKPDAIVDLATLTGAARVALGTLYACVLGTDQALVDALLEAGRATGEPAWQLPLVPEYRDDIKSSVADLKNVGGDAGTITAALFLQEFVDGVPWAHLDIAGPAFTEKDLPHAPRGATGYGVRLLIEWMCGLART
jgi:leucyl aminopeptidase